MGLRFRDVGSLSGFGWVSSWLLSCFRAEVRVLGCRVNRVKV